MGVGGVGWGALSALCAHACARVSAPILLLKVILLLYTGGPILLYKVMLLLYVVSQVLLLPQNTVLHLLSTKNKHNNLSSSNDNIVIFHYKEGTERGEGIKCASSSCVGMNTYKSYILYADSIL